MRAVSTLAVQASSALPTPLNSWLAWPLPRKPPNPTLPLELTVAASSVSCTGKSNYLASGSDYPTQSPIRG